MSQQACAIFAIQYSYESSLNSEMMKFVLSSVITSVYDCSNEKNDIIIINFVLLL